jgi:CysZ protein
MISNPITGAGYLLRGFKLLLTPGVRRYVVIPLFINIVLFGSIIFLGVGQFEVLLEWLMPSIPEWLQWVSWLLWILFLAATLLIVFYTFTIIANIISAPFNAYLAEAIERHLTGQLDQQPFNLATVLNEAAVSLTYELKKIAYLGSRALILLALFLIPGINVAAPLLWLAFSAWSLALEYADYPMSNHSIRFPAVREKLRGKRMLSLGFGSATLAATLVPFINLMVIPAAVAGATAMWVEQFKQTD